MEFPSIIKNNQDYIVLAALLLAILNVIGLLPNTLDMYGIGSNIKFLYLAIYAGAAFVFYKTYSIRGRASRVQAAMQYPQQQQYQRPMPRPQQQPQQQYYPQQQYQQPPQPQYQYQPQAPPQQFSSPQSRMDYVRQQQTYTVPPTNVPPSPQQEQPQEEQTAVPKQQLPKDLWETFNKE